MNAAISRFFIFVFFIGLLFMQASLHQFLFSLTPLMIIIPVVAVWGSDRPLLWIVPWIIAAEVFTTEPVGIMTAVTLLPLGMKWLLRSVTTDLSFSFLGAIAGTVLVQLCALGLAHALQVGRVATPWLIYSEILCCCTIVAFVVCSIWMQVKPLYD